MTARIISVENPKEWREGTPDCTDYRHSKFIRRRRYVEVVLLPQMARLMPTQIFPAVTNEHFTVDAGQAVYGDIRVRIGAGSTGNFLSHVSLWRQCVPLLVLEDDAHLPQENAGNVMDAIGEFAKVYSPAVLHLLSAMPHRETGTKDFGDYEPAGGLLRLRSAGDLSGTAAYAVNPKGARVLYDAAMCRPTLPTDGFIHRAFERGEIAVYVPTDYRRGFMLHEHWAAWNHDHKQDEG